MKNKDHRKELLSTLLPLLKEKGSMTRLAEYLGVHRQHVFKWVREGMGLSYNNGKNIELWIQKKKKK